MKGQISFNRVIFENLYDDGQSFWFTEYTYNSLFRMDKGTWKAEWVGMFPGEAFAQKRLYVSTAACNGKLYFAPNCAKEIAEYDLQENCFRKLPFCAPDRESCASWEYAKFFKVFSHKDKIYFIPDRYPGILCYDTKTGDFSIFDEWIAEIERLRRNGWGYFVDAVQTDNKLYLPCMCADAIVIFDMDAERSWVIQKADKGPPHAYCGICHADHNFYLVSTDGTVLKRKLKSPEEEVKVIRPPVSGENEIEFYPVRYLKPSIYLLPFGKNQGFKIDTETDQMTRETFFDSEREIPGRNASFLTGIISGRRFYAVTGNSYRFLEYDFEEKCRREIEIRLSENDQREIEAIREQEFARMARESCMAENEIYTLPLLLAALQTEVFLSKTSGVYQEPEKGKDIYLALLDR